MSASTHLKGALLYGNETTAGTAVTASVAAGMVTDGEFKIDNQLRKRVGLGGNVQVRPGLIVAEGSFTIICQEGTLSAAAFRGSYPAGALPSKTYEGGRDGYSIRLVGGKINSCTWSATFEDALKAAFAIMAQFGVEASGVSSANLADTTLEDFEGNVTLGATDYDCQSFECALANNCKRLGDISTKTTNEKRRYQQVIEGLEAPTVRFTFLTQNTTTITNDTIATLAALTAFTDAGGVNSMSFAYSGLVLGMKSVPFQGGDDLWVQSVEFPEVAPGAVVLTVV